MAERQGSGASKAPRTCEGTFLGRKEGTVECPNLPCSLWVPVVWVYAGKVGLEVSLAVDGTDAP